MAIGLGNGGTIHVGGGSSGTIVKSSEFYDTTSGTWTVSEDLPDNLYGSGSIRVGEKLYLIGGKNGSGYTNKLFSAYLPTPAANLFFKDGNATAEANLSTFGLSTGGITLGMLGKELLEKIGLASNPATEKGRLLAVPYNTEPPSGYLLYEKNMSVAGGPVIDLYFLDANHTGRIKPKMLGSALAEKFELESPILLPPGLTRTLDHFENPSTELTALQRKDRDVFHTWSEVAQVGRARRSPNGGVSLNGKMYFIGGFKGSTNMDRYDPATNVWTSLPALPNGRNNPAATVLNGKIYVMGENTYVNIFDPSNNSWSLGTPVPETINGTAAITVGGKIYLMGGAQGSTVLKVNYMFDPVTNLWTKKADMPIARHSHTVEYYNGRIWVLAGDYMVYKRPRPTTTVQSYDPKTDEWRVEADMIHSRHIPNAWNANGRLYIGGSRKPYKNYIDVYNPFAQRWESFGNTPYNPGGGGDSVLNDKAYLISGSPGDGSFSKKVHAADLLIPRDLYFRTIQSSPANRIPSNLRINTPTEFSENLPVGSVIGTFKANDADGDDLTFQIAQGPGSNTHALFSLDFNGTLKTAVPFDYENNATQYVIRVLVKDDKNASIQKSFLFSLIDVYEAPPNSPPSGLKNNHSLSMNENLPIGTPINHFSAHDPDGNASLAFFLVDGNASLNNHLFLLEMNGTLRTAALFDYESNRSTYFIRIQARDDRNASIEKILFHFPDQPGRRSRWRRH